MQELDPQVGFEATVALWKNNCQLMPVMWIGQHRFFARIAMGYGARQVRKQAQLQSQIPAE
jgi:hypothetical protein